MSGKYILDGRTAVKEPDLLKWAAWLERADRRVDFDRIGDIEVSTVFLGMDHNFAGSGAPLLFETMIFGGSHDQYQERTSTWEEAEARHAAAPALVRAEIH